MSVEQYLRHYAEPEANQISGLGFEYHHVLTIPVFDEPESFIKRLQRIYVTKSSLIVLVLNAPDNLDSDSLALKSTQSLSARIKSHCTVLKTFSSSIHLYQLNQATNTHILLIDRCDPPYLIPKKEGVGLARKIACDIACKLISIGEIKSPWVHSTDADVELPKNYFLASQNLNPKNIAVGLYPFQHQFVNKPKLQLRQQLYDLSLHYYVDGLTWAKSPFAYHTIGSTLLINYQTYALCRGFPKRAAGEDFYLLNKIAKIGNIVALQEPIISIDTRESSRVPFGTGPAIIKMKELENPIDDFLYYNPLCFDYLKLWLSILPRLWENKSAALSSDLFDEAFCKTRSPKQQDSFSATLLLNCLCELKVEQALEHALNHSTKAEIFMGHMHNWFDSFRTLKLIHLLRASLALKGKPSINLSQLTLQAPFLSEKSNQIAHSLIT